MKPRRRGSSPLAGEGQWPLSDPEVVPEVVVSPLAARVWTDADGTGWTRRGSQVSTSRGRQLLGRADVTVMHAYLGAPVRVAMPEREALWLRVQPYLRELAREPGDHTDFLVGEFRSASGDYFLMFEERC